MDSTSKQAWAYHEETSVQSGPRVRECHGRHAPLQVASSGRRAHERRRAGEVAGGLTRPLCGHCLPANNRRQHGGRKCQVPPLATQSGTHTDGPDIVALRLHGLVRGARQHAPSDGAFGIRTDGGGAQSVSWPPTNCGEAARVFPQVPGALRTSAHLHCECSSGRAIGPAPIAREIRCMTAPRLLAT